MTSNKINAPNASKQVVMMPQICPARTFPRLVHVIVG